MAVDANIIALFLGANASIPANWSRETALDGKHLKGLPDNTTNPGTTGGNATHTHTSPAHTHTITSHTHQIGGASWTPNAVTASSGTATGIHSHGAGTSGAPSANTEGDGTVTLNATSNDPAYVTAIAIKSDGSTNFPNGCLLLYNNLVAPAGWSLCDGNNGTVDLSAKYIKIAGAGADGNGTGGSNTHTHTNSAHNHTYNSHTHAGTTANTAGSYGSSGSRTLAVNHNHTYTSGAATDTSTSDAVTIDTVALEPPYVTFAYIKNTSGSSSLVNGLIAIWIGLLANIPANWALCDGNAGRPNLLVKFVRGTTTSIGDNGGNTAVHAHTPSAHGHTHTGHVHAGSSNGPSATGGKVTGTGQRGANGSHTHTLTCDSVAPVIANATITLDALANTGLQLPEYYEVAYIQYTAPADTYQPRESAMNFQDPAIYY